MAANPLERITKELRDRPLLFAGGGALLLVGATLVSRNQASMGEGEGEPVTDPEADGDLLAEEGGTLGFGSAYTMPSYSGTYTGTYDPFTGDPTGQTPPPATTPPATTPPPATKPPASSTATGSRITIPKGRKFHYYRRDPRTGRYVSVGTRTAGSAVTWKTGQPVTGRTAGGSSITLVRLTSGPLSGYYVGRGIGAWQR
ncbi:MAG: hypothetical protein IT352_15400 [Gemmatimonadales bacterium]|nr:hypothetical protein [Gemmatimonadales bacterium]